ncbi:transposase [Clostridium sp. YIM B02505]|uniref:Transposase n=1 Tax=Clostridium yunnanense TaxID=2800325 RepID=A0ABS1EI48_9CLOT|nr:transposase [Clostridium yunnanense]MBK1809034.1 transposase [Clostridium yunnanense]
MPDLLSTLESSSDTIVYALDETGVSIESDNRLFWSPVGHPPVLEKNGSHAGVNIIGSTSILSDFHTINDIYLAGQSITSNEVKSHLSYLLDLNKDKKVVVFMDNAKNHTSKCMQEFYFKNRDRLKVINLPRYSPQMNPQEHIWRNLKAKLFRPSARSSIYELISDIKNIFIELNSKKDEICSLAYARNYLV